MGRVRIELDADRFDRLFGTTKLVERFEGVAVAVSAATGTSQIPTLEVTQVEIEEVDEEVPTVDLASLGMEPVDDPETAEEP